ncbi:MAG: DUF5063 domain-containing protein [Muribaculaceae bacterium]|nr:DUF5063 domain-containing protein [Muribaculaceae bacterium]
MALNTNSLSFIGLANEYCQAVMNVQETERNDFINSMLHLLPRLYITATDLRVDEMQAEETDSYLDNFMTEEEYDMARRSVEQLMGEDDVYLEVFEEDMKYSDTPVSASIAEGVADIYQVMYNFLSTVRDSTDEVVDDAILAVKSDFRNYWSATLCNLLRALNHLYSF